MSVFSKVIAAETRAAPRVELITPNEFAESWSGRPKTDIAVGLRVPSERDYRVADAEGDKEDSDAGYNRRVMDIIVARGVCDPNDVCGEHPAFPLAEDTVPIALKPRTIKRLFDAIERLSVEQSPVYAEATDSEIDDLWSFLSNEDRFAGMREIDMLRCRRYLRFALDHFLAVDPPTDTE